MTASENKPANHGDEEEKKKKSRAAKMLSKVGSFSTRSLSPAKKNVDPASENTTANHGDEEEKKRGRAATMFSKVGSLSSRVLVLPVRSIASKLSSKKKAEEEEDKERKRQSLALEDLLRGSQIDKAILDGFCEDWDLMDSNYDGLDVDEDDGDDDDDDDNDDYDD